ncbi:MAG: hypothetical protein SV760_05940, partial [Halobacteria archaeon]|nr:hypothetical protein [Halobacteria archaeon]
GQDMATNQTDAEAYGVGLKFEDRWDFDVEAGSIALTRGEWVLARDLAWATTIELGEKLNQRLTTDLAEEIKIALRRVARRDDRVDRVVSPIVVSKTEDAGTAEVDLEIVAAHGVDSEFVLTI